jgi:hypothetical protein
VTLDLDAMVERAKKWLSIYQSGYWPARDNARLARDVLALVEEVRQLRQVAALVEELKLWEPGRAGYAAAQKKVLDAVAAVSRKPAEEGK